MAYKPIPAPLRDVLQGVLHANLFATWQEDLIRWERGHPGEAASLRTQLAESALADTVDPDHLRRLSGHWVEDVEATKSWFRNIYREYYGRPPASADIGPQ